MYTELDNAFTSGTEDGAVVYEKSRENLELRIPDGAADIPHAGARPGVDRTRRITHRRRVVVRYPLAILFFTGI